MTTLSKWQRKLVLLVKSERRLNAGKIIKTFNNKSIDEMKSTIITESMCNLETLTDKRKTKDLECHLNNLKYQMRGHSELYYYHNTLIILLRRKYKIIETFAEFKRLWDAESDYLLEHISLRWIVSACDTFIDHSDDNNKIAILMNVVTLINTLRAYETKNFLQLPTQVKCIPLVDDKVAMLYQGDLPLYDDLTYFRIGGDDSLKNMRRRYEKFYEVDYLATTILLSVFDKLQTHDNAFHTLRLLHKDERSRWWLD
ncbi:hypothetical protein [Psychrobacter aquaticus]|uniref:Uncharacterized protein n=1 Tax=Psychrobacter aquaticus CMS 56 TaxID=1354303 RepID=U4T7I1_9GAMM|nr:hypothetical protein [Psychrobacter aquaticus]ERL54689.1 hypothetical protein M917_2035 [Psychrobacter aquaticus CMS 56]